MQRMFRQRIAKAADPALQEAANRTAKLEVALADVRANLSRHQSIATTTTTPLVVSLDKFGG